MDKQWPIVLEIKTSILLTLGDEVIWKTIVDKVFLETSIEHLSLLGLIDAIKIDIGLIKAYQQEIFEVILHQWEILYEIDVPVNIGNTLREI